VILTIVCFFQFNNAFANSGFGISDSIVEAYFNEENSKSLIIIQGERLIYEQNYSAIPEIKNQTSPLFDRLAAISLFYSALKEGYIYSVEEPVRKYLPELPEKDFSLISLSGFLNLDSINRNAFKIPGRLAEINTSTRDTFQILTNLYCLIVERATGIVFNDYFKNKLMKPIDGFSNTIVLNSFKGDTVINSESGLLIAPNDWLNIAHLFLQVGKQNSLSIKNGSNILFISKSEKLIILWIGRGNNRFDIYDFIKKLSEPG
jgi:hypothetical protein